MRDPWRSEQVVAQIGGEADGIVRSDLAVAQQVSLRSLARLRGRGVLVPVAKGVDRLRDHPFDHRARCRAALAIAGPDAVLGLRTAARLNGSWAHRDSTEVEVLSPRGRDHRTPVGRYIETRWLPERHITTVDGFPVTAIGRTFFDLCGDPDPGLTLRHPVHEQRMRQLYNDCLGRRGMTFTMAVAVLSVMARRGRRGTRLAREILRSYGPKHKPTKSDVETLFFELVRTYGLPEPERQAVIAGWAGFIGTVDFAWRDARLVVEVDSSWHDGPLDEEVDEERDRMLEAAGYQVERYRFPEIVFEPGRVARELAAKLDGVPTRIAARTVG
jgi:very-short-patch-repair endonuclease